MADEGGFPNIVLNIGGLLASAILPIFILRYLQNKEKKEEKKAAEIKLVAESTARELKESTEKNARDLREVTEKNAITIKDTTERIASDLQRDTTMVNERLATELKTITEKIALDLLHQTEKKNAEILQKLSDMAILVEANSKRVDRISDALTTVNTKQEKMGMSMETMISNLHQKADITNGNVENIRNDLLSLQEDTDEVFEKMSGSNMTGVEVRAKRKKRELRRREIAMDSKKQHSAVKSFNNKPWAEDGSQMKFLDVQ